MNPSSSLRGSRSTLSRRRDKPWRVSAQLPDQKAPTRGLGILCHTEDDLVHWRAYSFNFISVCQSLDHFTVMKSLAVSLLLNEWRSVNIVGHINEVCICGARLVLRCVTISGHNMLVFNQAT